MKGVLPPPLHPNLPPSLIFPWGVTPLTGHRGSTSWQRCVFAMRGWQSDSHGCWCVVADRLWLLPFTTTYVPSLCCSYSSAKAVFSPSDQQFSFFSPSLQPEIYFFSPLSNQQFSFSLPLSDQQFTFSLPLSDLCSWVKLVCVDHPAFGSSCFHVCGSYWWLSFCWHCVDAVKSPPTSPTCWK